MRIAFVGVKRKYCELDHDYVDHFNRFHLELPYYYAFFGGNDVTISTVDMNAHTKQCGKGSLTMLREDAFMKDKSKFDVVLHWRKWFQELHRPESINLINCQDHSFDSQWKEKALTAILQNNLHGVLCFPGWHKRNLHEETLIPREILYEGVTLGVDTDIYKPSESKDPYQMLWASDPGRGLEGALNLALKLFNLDRRFRLHVCYPDYVQNRARIEHPAIVFHANIKNGKKLWDLFGTTGILPYTSNFREPSSRAHRQAQAAGSFVLYPPSMGTPSEIIENGKTGVVADITEWTSIIVNSIKSSEWAKIGKNARALALSENWEVQAERFNKLVEKIRS